MIGMTEIRMIRNTTGRRYLSTSSGSMTSVIRPASR
jgi:hypothetical protein